MSWWRRRKREQDLERELRSHLEAETAEQQKQGLSADEAHYAARRGFGNTTLVKEEVRAIWGGRWIGDFFQDVRHAARQLRKAPGFTAVAVITLALGIGANTAIFTLINGVLLKSLPVLDPSQLVVFGDGHASGSGSGIPLNGSFSLYSYDLYKHLQDAKVFEGLCAVQSDPSNVSVRQTGWSDAQAVHVKLVSGNYFHVLGVNAAIGRTITPSDDSPSAPLVGVVSFRYWKEKLHGDPSVVGSTLDLGNTSVTIIGVASSGFYGETLTPDPPGFWLPISADPQLNRELKLIDDPDEHWLYLIGRVLPNISITQAQSRLTAVLRNWLLARGGSNITAERRTRISKAHVQLTPGGSGVRHLQSDYSWTLRLLLGISIAVLLITCANIANLLLARGTAQKAETSVRLALGASRWRLVRQSLTESLTVALFGGALGLVTASAGTKLLIALFFRGTEYVPIGTSPDPRVLAFTFTLSCAAAIVFGLLPAVRTSSNVAPLINSGRAGIKGSRLSHGPFGLGTVLIAGEVALSLVVLAGAGSFARSLENLTHQQFGFDREHVLVVNVDTSHAGYDSKRLGSLYRQIYSRLNSLPGVKSASLSYYSPFNGCCWSFTIGIQGYTPKGGAHANARLDRVSMGYFQTLGTRLLEGRSFNERDTSNSRRIAVVNEELVRRYFPNENPIGKHFSIGDESNVRDLEIVGVVENAKYDSPREQPLPMAFLALLQMKTGESASSDQSNFINVIEVRSSGHAATVAAEVRHALADIDPHLPVLRISTLAENVTLMLNQENVIAALATFFGFVALVLSCLGLYGLMAYAVQRRTSEIGIRIALGARRGSVIGMVTREALLQGLTGILVGVPAAFAVLQLVRSQLYGVNPNDPTYSAAAAVLLLFSIAIAAYVPARRASRVDPLIALRYE